MFSNSRIIYVIIAFVMLLAYAILGTLDMQAEHADKSLYCDMVGRKLWPDYNHNYQAECVKPQ